ncbi:MAG: L-serine ammonia-lyase, iron-sulfur-dependent, subunit alpha [Spirochaetia bacterium]|jgi:L-cysteine desulfidase|nr:L-serine ammonia-lyase, iron-sulfur-dependent, subunit alpha [Spirochaetia bacterium]
MQEKDISKKISTDFSSIIENELKLTVGCTDPVAIALATASASSVYFNSSEVNPFIDNVEKIILTLDLNIYKNAFSVGVPGTGMKGIPIAAVLGLLVHDVSKGLMIFSDLDIELINSAIELTGRLPIEIEVTDKFGDLYVESKIIWKDGSISASAIKEYHDNIIWTETNGLRTPITNLINDYSGSEEIDLTIDSLIWITENIKLVPNKILENIAEAIEINMRASETGLFKGKNEPEQQSFEYIYGSIELKKQLRHSGVENHETIFIPDNEIISEARARVASATRLRMRGEVLPIMACGGSGNHGITFFITLNIGWKMEGIVPGRSIYRASALGILLLHLIKKKTGILTPMCGCAIASGLAASAALAWGLGGNADIMLQAMNLVFSSLGGVVCDGAKPACSFKTSLSTQVAIESARMAVSGVYIPPEEGLSFDSFSNLLNGLQMIHEEGMSNFNKTLVTILKSKF